MGKNSEEAIARTIIALTDFVIEGVPTTIPFHLALLKDERFLSGAIATNSVESHLIEDLKASGRISAREPQSRLKTIQKDDDEPIVVPVSEAAIAGTIPGPVHNFEVQTNGRQFLVAVKEIKGGAKPSAETVKQNVGTLKRGKIFTGSTQEIKAPMHGLVKAISVCEEQAVESGQLLLIFEAMKMETSVYAEISGQIEKIYVKPGQTVGEDALLLSIESKAGKRVVNNEES